MTRILAPLQHRDFALLWFGQSVSMLGDGVFTVTLALEALRVDHSPSGLAYVLAARLLPATLLALVGGAVVDRVPRRLAMVASDATRCLAAAAIAVLVLSGALGLAGLVGMALVFGIADAFFFPASTAITPEVVPAELLVEASALSGTSRQLGQLLIGPAVGGLVFGLFGASWGFGLDAVSFAVGAASVVLMTARPRPAPRGRSVLSDISEGLRFCRSQRWLWVSLLSAGLGNFVAFSPLGLLIPLLVKQTLHESSVAVGLVFAVGGLGGLLASLVLGKFGVAPPHRITFLWLGWGLSGLGVVGLGLVPDVWLAGAAVFVTFGLDAYGSALWNPLIQQHVPPELIGRVSSVDYLVSLALSPLGLVAAGAMAEVAGVRTTLLIGGGITALTTLVPLIPGVRVTDPRPPPQSSRASPPPR